MTEHRLKQLRRSLEMNQENLAKILGIGKTALSMIETGKASLTERNKSILVEKLNVNPSWIERGTGEMFNLPKDFKENIATNNITLQEIPIYEINHVNSLESILRGTADIQAKMYLPMLPKCDGAITISWDTMSPKYSRGDIAIFSVIRNPQEIIWGESYLICMQNATGQLSDFRYAELAESSQNLILRAHNGSFIEKEVPRSCVKMMAIIRAVLKINSI